MSHYAVFEVRIGSVDWTDVPTLVRAAVGEQIALAGIADASCTVRAIDPHGSTATLTIDGSLVAPTMAVELVEGDRWIGREELRRGQMCRFGVGGTTVVIVLLDVRDREPAVLPSPAERALLDAVGGANDELAALAIYGDWLLAQPARSAQLHGELIQVQCALAARPTSRSAARDLTRSAIRRRERELIAQLPTVALANEKLELRWSRGKLAVCRGDAGAFLRSVEEVARRAPAIAALELELATPANQSLIRQAAHTQLPTVTELTLSGKQWSCDRLIDALATMLPNLQQLRVRGLTIADGLTALTTLPAMTTIDLAGTRVTSTVMRSLAALTDCRITTLRLATCQLTAVELAVLEVVPWLTRLVELDLGNNDLRRAGPLAAIALPSIARLAAARSNIDRRLARAWCSERFVRRLHELRLHGNPLGDRAVLDLANAPTRALVDLDVRSCSLTDRAVTALAASRHLRALRALRLGGNRLGDASAHALVTATSLGALARIDLAHCAIGDDGAAALAGGPWHDHELVLVGNPIGERGARCLLESAARYVSLSPELIAPATRDRLRDRFGRDAIAG